MSTCPACLTTSQHRPGDPQCLIAALSGLCAITTRRAHDGRDIDSWCLRLSVDIKASQAQCLDMSSRHDIESIITLGWTLRDDIVGPFRLHLVAMVPKAAWERYSTSAESRKLFIARMSHSIDFALEALSVLGKIPVIATILPALLALCREYGELLVHANRALEAWKLAKRVRPYAEGRLCQTTGPIPAFFLMQASGWVKEALSQEGPIPALMEEGSVMAAKALEMADEAKRDGDPEITDEVGEVTLTCCCTRVPFNRQLPVLILVLLHAGHQYDLAECPGHGGWRRLGRCFHV